MTKPARPLRSWGDLNAALNGLVREGVIETFRTNRDVKDAVHAIVLVLASGVDEPTALRAARRVLTGVFADAVLSVETLD